MQTTQQRSMGRTALVLVAGVLMVLGLGACGGEGEGSEPTGMGDMSEGHEDHASGDHDFAFGEPADEADADRTIEIEAAEGFVFTPEEVTIEAGEVVAFEVTNTDAIQHDFFLGDEAAQQAHEEEMMEMAEGDGEMAHDDPNALTIPAGETATLTWHFTEPGTIQYGCHEPGHYSAGMIGDITIE